MLFDRRTFAKIIINTKTWHQHILNWHQHNMAIKGTLIQTNNQCPILQQLKIISNFYLLSYELHRNTSDIFQRPPKCLHSFELPYDYLLRKSRVGGQLLGARFPTCEGFSVGGQGGWIAVPDFEPGWQ